MRVLAHDPYLSPERAAEWGVELVPLAGTAGAIRFCFAAHGALAGHRAADQRADASRR